MKKIKPSHNNQLISSIPKPSGFRVAMGMLFNMPLATIQKIQQIIPELTYRKINLWDEQGLISSYRENAEAGWRNFSLSDIFKLMLISDLRKFGFSTKIIKRTVSNLSPQLEYSIYLTMSRKQKIYFLANNQDNSCFATEEEILKSYFMPEPSSSILILPFYAYIKKIIKDLELRFDVKTPMQIVSEQEKKILDAVRKDNWEEITIIKSNGKELILKPKSRQRGSFLEDEIMKIINSKDYQNVTISVVDGKPISIVEEEAIKV